MSDLRHPKENNAKSLEHFRDGAAFISNIKENRAKTRENLLEIPSVTLPKGGGAIKGIDEKFAVNPSNGTAAYSIPLPLTPGRNSFTPALALSYNSGSGNSVFGLGWTCDAPSIQRKTEKKLPEYKDGEDTDTFIFSGVEDLVPVMQQDASGDWMPKTTTINGTVITYYRPRIESAFSRIEKIQDNGNIYWRVRSRENIVSVFGQSDKTRLTSPVPGEQYKIFRWCLQYSYDDKGNYIRYYYKKENTDNISPSVFERNRLNTKAPFSNIYLKGVQYGNTTPFYEGDPPPVDFLYELVFDFGEHNLRQPAAHETDKWQLREDPFSSCRAGFDIRTYRLCRRVLMFHHFKNELGLQDYLVKSMDFGYDENPNITYLEKITLSGYIWNPDGSLQSSQSVPPLEFSYLKPGFSREVKEIASKDIPHLPIGLDHQLYQWTDLYSEGIAGILTEQADGWFYNENEGNASFSPAKNISPRPNVSGLNGGTLSIQDLEADGKKYLVKTAGSFKGFYELTAAEEWVFFETFRKFPNIDLQDPNLKFVDLNGDGMPDMLLSCEQEFIWYAAKGKLGYDDYHYSAWAQDEEEGPRILFANKDQKMLVAIADMSGDGLGDIVLVTPANVYYYPNLGYGRFGAKVTLAMNGCIDSYEAFNPAYLRLSDIDGSGTTDIIYIGHKKIQLWVNQSGNSLAGPSEFFNPFPPLDDQSRISFVDLLGNGTSCLVWSSPLPCGQPAPLRYIDLMNGEKPHVMYAHKNNCGREITLEYRSSTRYYLEDKQKGLKWVTKLPFPVQCVHKMIVRDKVSQTRFSTEYSYHHGYYDGREREFRGFARVDQKDCEEYDHYVKATQAAGASNSIEKDLFQPAVITKTWFHTGLYLNRKNIFHQLQQEYYPEALINSGQITDPTVLADLSGYIPEDHSILPSDLAAEAVSECYRALKGLPLHQEIYSDEGEASVRLHPYSVVHHHYEVQLIQPKKEAQHAVFLRHEKETFTYHFERNPLDPRIAHAINTEIDAYGNVLQSAAVVYGRKKADPALPTDQDRQQQTVPHIIYTQNLFTALIDSEAAYRPPVLCETESWELNASPSGNYYTADEIKNIFHGATEVLYDQEATAGKKRKIEHSRTLFLKNDLSGPLPLGVIDTLALPYENYLLAFTSLLAQSIYGGKYDEGLWRNQAYYISFQNDHNYWIKSGRTYYHPDLSATPDATVIAPPTPADIQFAKNNFYLPVAYEDNFNHLTKLFYDPYKIIIIQSIDPAANNTTVESINYRLPAPYLLRDANDNRAGVRFDELGRVIRSFVMGKEGEYAGDPMDTGSLESSPADQPTTILEHDFRYFTTNGKLPNRVKTSVREKHYYQQAQPAQSSGGLAGWLKNIFGSGGDHPQTESDAVWQDSYAYSDGSGQVLLQKMQAEPGLAPGRDVQGNLQHDASGNLLVSDTTPDLRWVGSGRTVFNNKGNPVKQYEPYFDSSPEYNTERELTEIGFTPVIYYDAIGRMIRRTNPNGTFSRVEFDAWMQRNYDENDTVKDSPWYQNRISGAKGEAEQQAAEKAAVHDHTPMITYLDSLGRPFLSAVANKTQRSNESVSEEIYYTRTELDIEGNAKSMIDARGNTVMNWKYDMLGNICYQHSMDAGDRWTLRDVTGKTLRLWDNGSQVFSYEYDSLHRPLHLMVNTGTGETTFEQYQYGENAPGDKQYNLRGKLYIHYDTAGKVVNQAYDFKGNRLVSVRTLLKDYKNIPDWKSNPALDSTESFTDEKSYDALSRLIQSVEADGSIILPSYNPANLLNKVDINIRGAGAVTHFVNDIHYNAKGQREQIYYGNNTTTRYEYEPETYRLTRLVTTGNNGAAILQDLNYTYDPVGNITRQFDNAQKTVFYGGQRVEAKNDYNYDAVYRLIEAAGREHTGQAGYDAQDHWSDHWSKVDLQPNAPMQLRNYTQKYFYDGVGNILRMQHIAAVKGSWTRSYTYNPANNQLIKTHVGGQQYAYSYNPHGSMLSMPQLTAIDWNFREEMQHAGLGGGGEVWYVYDSSGRRIRKVVERAGNKTEERLYLGMVEIYRERTGGSLKLERETLHVMDDQQRIAMVETRTAGNDGSPKAIIRYQYSDHLGSSCLELDDAAKIISYEEYHPYGTTAYQATDASRQVPLKRYRYTGMERDDETGLNYHTARYYAPWLGRWTAADPMGIKDNLNVYGYVSNNPVKLVDLSGNGAWERFVGGLKTVGGAVETAAGATLVAAGAASSEIGIGIPIAAAGVFVTAHGIDTTVAGARQVYSGKETDTGTSTVLQKAGMSKTAANLVDAAIGIVGTLGAGALAKLPAVAGTSAEALPAAARALPAAAEAAPNAARALPAATDAAPAIEKLAPAVEKATASQRVPALVGKNVRQMRRAAAKIIRSDKDHPLEFLLDETGKFKTTRGLSHAELADRPDLIQMGHIVSKKSGLVERIMLQGAWENQLNAITVEKPGIGAFIENEAIDIKGIAVDLKTARFWESIGWLEKGALENATRVK